MQNKKATQALEAKDKDFEAIVQDATSRFAIAIDSDRRAFVADDSGFVHCVAIEASDRESLADALATAAVDIEVSFK